MTLHLLIGLYGTIALAMSVVLAKSVLVVLICAAVALGLGCSSDRSDRLAELEQKIASLEASLSEARSANEATATQAREEAYADCRVLLKSIEEANWELQARIWESEGIKPYTFRVRRGALPPGEPSDLAIDVALRRTGAIPDDYLLRMSETILSGLTAKYTVRQASFYFWTSEEFGSTGEAVRAFAEWGVDTSVAPGEVKARWSVGGKTLQLVLNETYKPVSLSGLGSGLSARGLLFTESGRQQIFADLLKRQDEAQGESDYQGAMQDAKEEIASEYGITIEELNSVVHEGTTERWYQP